MQEIARILLFTLFSGFLFGVSERTIVTILDPTVGNISLWFCAAGCFALAIVSAVALKMENPNG